MLKDTQIKALKPKEKSYTVADGNGLSIVVNPNKSKKWRYRYRINGKAKTFSIGSYPEVSLANAREKLHEARSMVANGIDPAKVRKEEKVAKAVDSANKITFKEVKNAYLESIEDNVSIHHYERSESLLRLYAESVLNNVQIEDITHKDIKSIIMALVDMDKKPSAKKLFGVLKQVFDYAEARDQVEVNVCNLISTSSLIKNYHPKKQSTMTKNKDIKLLMESIENYTGHYANKKALQFMAFTSLRSANIRYARWNQMDLNNKIMTIPKAEMKIERKRLEEAEDFILPLSTQAIKLLESMIPLTGHGTYVFPSTLGDRPLSENALLVAIRRLGYTKEEFTPHGFRAMFATVANREGSFNLEIIDAQLAHTVGNKVSQAYNRTDYFDKRKELVQWWADWLESL